MVRIKDTSKAAERIDIVEVVSRLGAKQVSLKALTKDDCVDLEPLGSPVIMATADMLNVCYYASRMLGAYGKSIDDVVGYRVVGLDEEVEFREACAQDGTSKNLPIVRYYGMKSSEE